MGGFTCVGEGVRSCGHAPGRDGGRERAPCGVRGAGALLHGQAVETCVRSVPGKAHPGGEGRVHSGSAAFASGRRRGPAQTGCVRAAGSSADLTNLQSQREAPALRLSSDRTRVRAESSVESHLVLSVCYSR